MSSGKDDKYDFFTDADLMRSLLLTQALLIAVSFLLLFILHQDFSFIADILEWNTSDVLLYGVVSGIFIVLFQIFLTKCLPEEWLEDDGLNERLFQNKTVTQIFIISLLVATCEEWLFRGVIQTGLGIVITSLIFTIIHVRYLKKPLLLAILIGISFWFGYIFLITGSLWVTIVAHFLVDFLLGLYIAKYDSIDDKGEEINGI